MKTINDDTDVSTAINSPEARRGFKSFELSKYTTQELKDELASREQATGYHYGHNIDITSTPAFCSDCNVAFYVQE